MAVGILIQSKADVNLPIKDGSTALMHASKGGHYGSVEALLDKGANAATKMNATDKANAGMNAAMWAAQLGHLEILKLLLDKGGVSVDEVKDDGFTALIFAAQYGRCAVIDLLKIAALPSTTRTRRGPPR